MSEEESNVTNALEEARLSFLATTEAERTLVQRNKTGQYATPGSVARCMVRWGLAGLGPRKTPIHLLDPAFGTGPFLSALLRESGLKNKVVVHAYDSDPRFAAGATQLYRDRCTERRWVLDVTKADFLDAATPVVPSHLCICNPPYVRHQHLSNQYKTRLAQWTRDMCPTLGDGAGLSRLSGLHAHFMCQSLSWLRRGGVAVWIVPTEMFSVNYGQAVKRYLCRQSTIRRVHFFDSELQLFDQAVVSSMIVVLRRAKPARDATVTLTWGASECPDTRMVVPHRDLENKRRWDIPDAWTASPADTGTMSDYFDISRGFATGANKFFVIGEDKARDLDPAFLTPVVPPPRRLARVATIPATDSGDVALPAGKRQYLFTCSESEATLRRQFPRTWAYIEQGERRNVHRGYICNKRPRWWSIGPFSRAPLLCTYMGKRSKDRPPIRVLANHSNATVTNNFLVMRPRPESAWIEVPAAATALDAVAAELNRIVQSCAEERGRTYGGGLIKVEPGELRKFPTSDELVELLREK